MAAGLNNRTVDPILQNGRETDIVIPIMGATGAGKSTYINAVLGRYSMEVGHSLLSQTAFVEPVVIDPIPNCPKLKGYRLVLVDTPGFDDTYANDFEILQRIATWLALSYKKGMVLGGVIYLHDISQDRFTGTARRNLEMFYHLCGEAALDKTVLATTKWGRVKRENGDAREDELRAEHWRTMVENGSETRRFLDDSRSGWDILNMFIKRASDRRSHLAREIGLQIQQELVNEKKHLSQTKAGKCLLRYLETALETQRQITALQEAAARSGEEDAKKTLEEKKRELNKLVRDIRALKMSIPQRIRKFLGLLRSEIDAA